MVVVSAVLGKYYSRQEYQEEIDLFIEECVKTSNAGFVAISITLAENRLIDELEDMLNKFNATAL